MIYFDKTTNNLLNIIYAKNSYNSNRIEITFESDGNINSYIKEIINRSSFIEKGIILPKSDRVIDIAIISDYNIIEFINCQFVQVDSDSFSTDNYYKIIFVFDYNIKSTNGSVKYNNIMQKIRDVKISGLLY